MELWGDLAYHQGVRPLFHPSIEDVSVEAILHALSDPVRVAIFTEVAASNCSMSCTDLEHASSQAIPKSTLSQHFKALREAGLIRSERRGVEMQNTSRCAELDKRFPGLIRSIVRAHDIQQRQAAKSPRHKSTKRAVRRA
jgi:DNA-binding transcriptional ArsR family regulator